MNTPPPELAVIIVSWNTRDLTLDALRTLFADLDANGPQAEVWVVDNASTDGSADAIRGQFPQVHLVACQENLGFAGGNNHALRLMGFDPAHPAPDDALPRAVYLLNSDTRTHDGATRVLYDTLLRGPRAGVVGARLFYADGSHQHSAFRFPGLAQLVIDLFPVPARLYDSALNGRYPLAAYKGSAPFPVDHTLGATMMLCREVIRQTGLFDERYFMYCEEIDWSWRIRRTGWEIYCVPTAHVTHLAGQSTAQVRPQSIVNLWRSRLMLFEAYYSPLWRALARRIVRAGIASKIRQTRAAATRGELPDNQAAQLIDAYRTVQTL
ncbi:glycosyltransferase family 2 protein [Aggregatilinea lenta]|uniref:glycosyltransferase family 2 protein n=1 Tax=Aggregatilinea lenta TaxID=913108 RepID=UPI000E5BC700|nr:glycosyltransferase family 2 protein [Aggregatilinea lenta]